MEIKLLEIDKLTPYTNNARNNEKAVDKVADSIKAFGFKVPIIIDGKNEIIAGHTRVLAAKELRLKEVPTIKVDDLTPEQIKAFRIADNKTSEYAEWNFELLAQEMKELRLADYDVSLTGFDMSEAEKLLDTLKETVEGENPDDDFEIELPEEPISKLGDIWLLGKHRLVVGDSTNAYLWREGASRLHPLEDRKQSDVWQIPRPKKSELHSTMKPVDLVVRAIKNSSNMKDIVLDLFGGSGTTLIACEETDRVCRMMELDPKYADMIATRYYQTFSDKPIFRNGEPINPEILFKKS